MKPSKLAFLILAVSLLALCPSTQAQSVADPVYTYIDRWEAKGYLEPGFIVRPYSPEVMRAILERVAGIGDKADAEAALLFLQRYASASFSVRAVHRSDSRLGRGSIDYRGETGGGIDLVTQVVPGVWTQGVLDVVLLDGNETVKPETERESLDIHDDGSMNFLPAGLSGDPMGVLYGLSSSTWFGSGQIGRASCRGRV